MAPSCAEFNPTGTEATPRRRASLDGLLVSDAAIVQETLAKGPEEVLGLDGDVLAKRPDLAQSIEREWADAYEESGRWMLGVVVALLAIVCMVLAPPETSPLSLIGFEVSGIRPFSVHDGTELEPQSLKLYELWRRAHHVIHSAVTAGGYHFHVPGHAPSTKEELETHAFEHLIGDLDTERAFDIYCHGPLLHAVQMAGVYADSKHFVDMPLKHNSSAFDVLVDFHRRKLAYTEFEHEAGLDAHVHELRRFLDDHFDAPGADLLPITPSDYDDQKLPPMIAEIQDPELQSWAEGLHHLWRSLGRVPNPQVKSSFLHARELEHELLDNGPHVLIVPGGRFRETYYWDSYWIVQGLLVSGMDSTARGVVNHLLSYAADFGFVPNGARVYYLTRSQPPMLSDMVRLVAKFGEEDEDVEYISATLPILEKEYEFWMQTGPTGHAVELEWRAPGQSPDNTTTRTFVLNRYTSSADHPRPESYREDVLEAAKLFGETLDLEDGLAAANEDRKAQYYNDVIAATESGWDFSSRWLRDPHDLKSMATSVVLPVDLNAILFRVEMNLARFHEAAGNSDRAKFFEQAAAARQEAMDAVFWDEKHAAWKDFNLVTNTHSPIVSVSDYAPLWAGAFDTKDTHRLARIVKSLENSGLLQVGGVQTTTVYSGQQWDSPNAWSPLQDMVVEGLLAVNSTDSVSLARDVARTWVQSGLAAWQQTGLMYEKYNTSEVGGLGVGGEYLPQFGFGWTNGVILKFLTLYQDLLIDV